MSVTPQEAIHKISISLYRSTDLYNRALSNKYTKAASEFKRMMDAEQMAIDALREKAEREDPKPLTLEELLNMSGEPVWMVWPDRRIRSRWWIVGSVEWIGMEFDDPIMTKRYGSVWVAYRHKPKGE